MIINKNEIVKLIQNGLVKKVRFVDDSNYESGKCCNGGSYGFTETYYKITDIGDEHFGNFYLSYGTTSDFSYCEMCGTFTDNCGCEYHTVITEEKLSELILNEKLSEKCYIDAEIRVGITE
jgi:hypothetical protein